MSKAQRDGLETIFEYQCNLAEANTTDVFKVVRKATVYMKTLDVCAARESFEEQLHHVTLAVMRRGRMGEYQ